MKNLSLVLAFAALSAVIVNSISISPPVFAASAADNSKGGLISSILHSILNSIPRGPFAGTIKDPRDYTENPDFDINRAGINLRGDPFIQVYGEAGGTRSDTRGIILAYVFVTDAGIYAVTSHGGIEDSTEVPDDEQYHAHLVTLGENNCVTSIKEDGKAVLQNKRVIVTGTDATEVNAALTAKLTASNDHVCVTEVFDTAER